MPLLVEETTWRQLLLVFVAFSQSVSSFAIDFIIVVVVVVAMRLAALSHLLALSTTENEWMNE